MYLIAIDGACRRNGKPDCIAAGGVFIMHFSSNGLIGTTGNLIVSERNSTNQRGEMLALIKALKFIGTTDEECNVVTDSEYLFNTITKEWYMNWQRKGWVTAMGEPVKNQDLWAKVVELMSPIKDRVQMYYCKGHCISLGAKTSMNIFKMDNIGHRLYNTVLIRLYANEVAMVEKLENAQSLSEKNNGYRLPIELLYKLITVNYVADTIATYAVDEADAAFMSSRPQP